MSFKIAIKDPNGNVLEKEVLVAYRHMMRIHVIVRNENPEEGTNRTFILKKGLFNTRAQQAMAIYKEEYVKELMEKEVGELFFKGDSEAEIIDTEVIKKKFKDKIFDYEFNPLFKSTNRVLKNFSETK